MKNEYKKYIKADWQQIYIPYVIFVGILKYIHNDKYKMKVSCFVLIHIYILYTTLIILYSACSVMYMRKIVSIKSHVHIIQYTQQAHI